MQNSEVKIKLDCTLLQILKCNETCSKLGTMCVIHGTVARFLTKAGYKKNRNPLL